MHRKAARGPTSEAAPWSAREQASPSQPVGTVGYWALMTTLYPLRVYRSASPASRRGSGSHLRWSHAPAAAHAQTARVAPGTCMACGQHAYVHGTSTVRVGYEYGVCMWYVYGICGICCLRWHTAHGMHGRGWYNMVQGRVAIRVHADLVRSWPPPCQLAVELLRREVGRAARQGHPDGVERHRVQRPAPK